MRKFGLWLVGWVLSPCIVYVCNRVVHYVAWYTVRSVIFLCHYVAQYSVEFVIFPCFFFNLPIWEILSVVGILVAFWWPFVTLPSWGGLLWISLKKKLKKIKKVSGGKSEKIAKFEWSFGFMSKTEEFWQNVCHSRGITFHNTQFAHSCGLP